MPPEEEHQLVLFTSPASLTLELAEHTDGLDDIARVGKDMNDVVFHGAHHAEARLETCSGRKRQRTGHKKTLSTLLVVL